MCNLPDLILGDGPMLYQARCNPKKHTGNEDLVKQLYVDVQIPQRSESQLTASQSCSTPTISINRYRTNHPTPKHPDPRHEILLKDSS